MIDSINNSNAEFIEHFLVFAFASFNVFPEMLWFYFVFQEFLEIGVVFDLE